MCQIAPFQMKCVNEEFDLMACQCHKLYCALTELKQEIPFVGKYVPDYRCPDFEIKIKKESQECD